MIELLVVIALISLLAAILFPVFARAREAGRKTTCQSNLRQVALSFALYAQDYDGFYPAATDIPAYRKCLWIGRLWRWPLKPYLAHTQGQKPGDLLSSTGGSPGILVCPSDSGAQKDYNSTSYAYSMAFYNTPADLAAWNRPDIPCAPRQPPFWPTAQNEAGVAYPGQKILVGEWGNHHDGRPRDAARGWYTRDLASGRSYAFADGHVKFVASGRIARGASGFPDPHTTVGGIAGRDIE